MRTEMSDVPIRRLLVSDFRCIEGTREVPFDAQVVLIHGPNGTGKTSILSALELALTGGIRSMERQSDRYRAHLPFFGQSYATVQADVADYLQAGSPGVPLTVNGARLEGTPAFNDTAANFYSERCYLDQISLGRLLDLYQSRLLDNEPTALEQFVNELLGLEKLDALLEGLSDANDFRLLKRLAVGVDEADREAKTAGARLNEASAQRTEARTEVANARASARAAIAGLHPDATVNMTDADLLGFIRSKDNVDAARSRSAAAAKLHQELIALNGRISALAERPTMQRIKEVRNAWAAATADMDAWEASDGAKVRAWEAAAQSAGANLSNEPRIAVEAAMNQAARELDTASDLRAQIESVSLQIVADRRELDILQTRLVDAHEHSSALVESLAALSAVVDKSDICPVCDRDFTEVSNHSLLEHIDLKLAELTTHGQQLVAIRGDRDQLAARIARAEFTHSQLTAKLLSPDQEEALERRHASLVELSAQATEIEAAKSKGAKLSQSVRDLQQSLENLEAASSEELHVRKELARFATIFEATEVPFFDSIKTASTELLERAEAQVTRLTDIADRHRNAAFEADRLTAAIDRESIAVKRVADLAEKKKRWDECVAEAKRRQKVARDVHEAATRARTAIVHRVFTDSLNEVWKAVFTRLAPNEGFIPRFGIPNATKKTFDIRLETIHHNGEASGPPQMMLSAGNLNTAALSLFLALHLAVEPIVPCLVFDDPVQAMDEVHVSQFAALIRLLAKQNDRQVIIAVHDRELFDYLTLELSPAFEGDELITIELGERSREMDRGITRHKWTPDTAISN